MCPAGVPTIGWGSTRYFGKPGKPKVKMGDTITEEDAQTELEAAYANFEKGVTQLVKVVVNDNQVQALVSFAFNVGVKALEGSTLLKNLNCGQYHSAAAQFVRWNKAGGKILKGLMIRRKKEQDLFLTPV